MKILRVNSLKKIKKAIPLVEDKIKVKLHLNKNNLTIEGSELNEYMTEKIIEAIDFGFEAEDALLLRKDDFCLEYVNMKEHTPRHNLLEIRARVIGTDGKAKRTIETLTGSIIAIQGNQVGVIVDTDHLSQTIQGIISLIQGAKHSNVFAYLERQNANLRKYDEDDLGLKDPKDWKNLD